MCGRGKYAAIAEAEAEDTHHSRYQGQGRPNPLLMAMAGQSRNGTRRRVPGSGMSGHSGLASSRSTSTSAPPPAGRAVSPRRSAGARKEFNRRAGQAAPPPSERAAMARRRTAMAPSKAPAPSPEPLALLGRDARGACRTGHASASCASAPSLSLAVRLDPSRPASRGQGSGRRGPSRRWWPPAESGGERRSHPRRQTRQGRSPPRSPSRRAAAAPEKPRRRRPRGPPNRLDASGLFRRGFSRLAAS